MGITTDSLHRLEKHGLLKGGYKMLELGGQNIYDSSFKGAYYGMVAKNYFTSIGIDHTSIDIRDHNGAIICDLRKKIAFEDASFDVVTDYGTTEHVEQSEVGGFYEAFKNIDRVCKAGGLMIHETPKTGHWIGHGENYVTKDFYVELAKLTGYEIVELTEHFAMGNVKDGCLVIAVLKKNDHKGFISEEQFKNLKWYKK